MRKYLYAALAGVVLVWLTAPAARAEVKPHALFGDGMVIQRDAPIVVWGKADPLEKIAVEIAFKGGVNTAQMTEVTADKDGNWTATLGKVSLEKPAKGSEAPETKGTLTIKGAKEKVTFKDVYLGDVWVASGQSNMEMHLASCAHAKEDIAASKNRNLRLFTVPKKTATEPRTEVNGKWLECGPETSGSFSAVAYYFGRDIQKSQGIPVGMIHSSWGGTIVEAWATRGSLEANPEFKVMVEGAEKRYPTDVGNYKKALEKYKADVEEHKAAVEKAKADGNTPPAAPKAPANPDDNPNRPCVLYNGMIAPLQPFAIKGAIWYQGESNAGRAYQYRTLFPTMIQSWRDSWKQPDLPFYFVQLAPWDPAYDPNKKEPKESAWAELREAQLLTSEKLPHTGMAVITDTVPANEAKDIHPKQKEPVGARLALAARALTYGEKIEYAGPLYDKFAVDGNQAVLSFTHVGKGLEAKGEALEGFTVAGEDKVFHNARAAIKGDKVVVTCDQVEKPVAVRYGWVNFPVVNLWNKDGLPASPFRTDDFPASTAPKK